MINLDTLEYNLIKKLLENKIHFLPENEEYTLCYRESYCDYKWITASILKEYREGNLYYCLAISIQYNEKIGCSYSVDPHWAATQQCIEGMDAVIDFLLFI